MSAISGKAHVYGDNIDTDRIIPGKFTKTLDLDTLAEHVLEDLDPHFSQRVVPRDMLVAGSNFGMGSSREHAPLAIKSAGISVVIARSFARIFYRNAINVGLPLVELPEHEIENGARLTIELQNGRVKDENAGRQYTADPLPPVMVAILNEGGLVPYLSQKGDYVLEG